MSSLFGISANGPSDASFYDESINQSLRFNQPDSSYLWKAVNAGTRNKSTFAWWMKRGKETIGQYNIGEIFCFGGSGGGGTQSAGRIILESNKLHVSQEDNNSVTWDVVTTQVFRDFSNWYHCVVVIDTTQSTAADRVKVYVNGNKITSFSTSTYPSQSSNTRFGLNGTNRVGVSEASGNPWSATYFDGYFADMYYLDGVAVSDSNSVISEFGEYKNGVWIPKEYTGSFGTNGFRLQFQNSSALGDDTSGNNNDFTVVGLTASDVVLDSPTNNFAVLNPLVVSNNTNDNTFAEGNLEGTTGNNAGGNITGSIPIPASGKWYWEIRPMAVGNGVFVGLWDPDPTQQFAFNVTPVILYQSYSGGMRLNGTSPSYGASFGTSDTVGIAVDVDGGTVTFYKNNSSQGATNFNGAGLFPVINDWYTSTNIRVRVNFGQDSTFAGTISAGNNADANGRGNFVYAPPADHLALCSENLPEPTLSGNAAEQPDDHFNTVLYSGTGSTRSVTGVGFQPDFIWIKRRDGGANHALYDSTRGGTNALRSNVATHESQYGDAVITFQSDGFQVAGSNVSGVNGSSQTFSSWNWKLNGGTTATNNDGNVTSTVQANTDAGTSIVTFPADNTDGRTVGHGLGVAPKLIITKNRANPGYGSAWIIYSEASSAGHYMFFTGAVRAANSSIWGNTAPTSSVFTVGNSTAGYSTSGANDVIAYCFADVEGYQKIGSYNGNAGKNTFIYTGFRPQFFMAKNTTTANGNWLVFDDVRDTDNPIEKELWWNITDQEYNNGRDIDFVSNGIKLRASDNNNLTSTDTYLFLAIARQPFKYSNAF